MLRAIPQHIRIRTKSDDSYREGWIDAAAWIHQEIRKIYHDKDIS